MTALAQANTAYAHLLGKSSIHTGTYDLSRGLCQDRLTDGF